MATPRKSLVEGWLDGQAKSLNTPPEVRLRSLRASLGAILASLSKADANERPEDKQIDSTPVNDDMPAAIEAPAARPDDDASSLKVEKPESDAEISQS